VHGSTVLLRGWGQEEVGSDAEDFECGWAPVQWLTRAQPDPNPPAFTRVNPNPNGEPASVQSVVGARSGGFGSGWALGRWKVDWLGQSGLRVNPGQSGVGAKSWGFGSG